MGQLKPTTQIVLNRWALNAVTAKIGWPIAPSTPSTRLVGLGPTVGGKIQCRSVSSARFVSATGPKHTKIADNPPFRCLSASVACFSNHSGNNNDGINSARELTTIKLSTPHKYVAHIELNRPKVKNAFSLESAHELVALLDDLDDDPATRCVILSGNGPDFTSGIDLKSFMTLYSQMQETDDVGRRAKMLRTVIRQFQAPFKRMDTFTKPILSVQHGLCYGLGMELAACSDIRYCSADTKYSIREVLIGIAADVGSLQKMPGLVNNQGLLRELIYTGRDVDANEAKQLGFVNSICGSKDETIHLALQTAMTIASRTPIAVQGAKQNLRFSSDKPFDVGLDYNAVWNMAMGQSGDVIKAVEAVMSRNIDDAEYDNY